MPTCTAVLAQLIGAGFLCRKGDGSYCRATDQMVRPRMAKADLQHGEKTHPRRAASES